MRMLTAEDTVRRRWLSLIMMIAQSGLFLSEPQVTICKAEFKLLLSMYSRTKTFSISMIVYLVGFVGVDNGFGRVTEHKDQNHTGQESCHGAISP
jgi:hypothetical protein